MPSGTTVPLRMGVRPGRGVEVGGGVEDVTGVRVAVAVGVTVSFGAGVDFEVGTSVGRGVAEAGALEAGTALVADGIGAAVPSSLRRSSHKPATLRVAPTIRWSSRPSPASLRSTCSASSGVIAEE